MVSKKRKNLNGSSLVPPETGQVGNGEMSYVQLNTKLV